MDITTFIIRIFACFILSICIGFERQLRHKTVGLRTNVLVSLGSFMFVCMSFKVINPDVTRIAAQVVSGIGFLGAGVILKDGNKIKGLDTAATLWCVSAVGVLCASGMIIEAGIGTIFILISNILLRIVSKNLINKNSIQEIYNIDIICNKDTIEYIENKIMKQINNYKLSIKSVKRKQLSKDETNLKIGIISNNKLYFNEIIKTITNSQNITSLNIEHHKLTNIEEDFDY